MKVNVRIQQGEIIFTSDIARANFFEKNEGKYAFIEIDDATTSEKRRYFEGCLVPTVFYTNPHSGWMNFKEAREALKIEFLGTVQAGMKGNVVRVAKSTAELSNRQFGQLIEAVVRWLIENELCVEDDIDPENYKAWRDSAPARGEIYPTLRRLKDRYDAALRSKKS